MYYSLLLQSYSYLVLFSFFYSFKILNYCLVYFSQRSFFLSHFSELTSFLYILLIFPQLDQSSILVHYLCVTKLFAYLVFCQSVSWSLFRQAILFLVVHPLLRAMVHGLAVCEIMRTFVWRPIIYKTKNAFSAVLCRQRLDRTLISPVWQFHLSG